MEQTKDNQFYGKVKTCKFTEWISNYDDDFDINSGIYRYDERGCVISDDEDETYEYNENGLLIKHCDKYHCTSYFYRGDGKLLEVIRYIKEGNRIQVRELYGEYGIEKKIEYKTNGVDSETTYIYKNGVLIKEYDHNVIINYKYDEYGRLIEEVNAENWKDFPIRYKKRYKYDYRDLLVESITNNGYLTEREELIYDEYGRVVEEYYYRTNRGEEEKGSSHSVIEYDKHGNCVKKIHYSYDDKKLYYKLLQEFDYYDGFENANDLPQMIIVPPNSEEGLLRKLACKLGDSSGFRIEDGSKKDVVKNDRPYDDLRKIIVEGFATKPFESLGSDENFVKLGDRYKNRGLRIKRGVYKLVHAVCNVMVYPEELNDCSCVPIIDDEHFYLIPLYIFLEREYPFKMWDTNSTTNDNYANYSTNYPVPYIEGEKTEDKIKRIINILSSIRTIQIHHSPKHGHWDKSKRDFVLTWAEAIGEDCRNLDLGVELSALEYRINEAIKQLEANN